MSAAHKLTAHGYLITAHANNRTVRGTPTQTRQRRQEMSRQRTVTQIYAKARRLFAGHVARGLVVLVGTGRAAHYLIAGKRLRNGSSGSPDGGSENGS